MNISCLYFQGKQAAAGCNIGTVVKLFIEWYTAVYKYKSLIYIILFTIRLGRDNSTHHHWAVVECRAAHAVVSISNRL